MSGKSNLKKGHKSNYSKSTKGKKVFLFDKRNYTLMIIGIVMVVIGFLLMTGGTEKSPTVFHADEIYSFRRITLAPIVIIVGFVVEVFAIMIKPKEKNPGTASSS